MYRYGKKGIARLPETQPIFLFAAFLFQLCLITSYFQQCGFVRAVLCLDHLDNQMNFWHCLFRIQHTHMAGGGEGSEPEKCEQIIWFCFLPSKPLIRCKINTLEQLSSSKCCCRLFGANFRM